jgi:hypothetical protein
VGTRTSNLPIHGRKPPTRRSGGHSGPQLAPPAERRVPLGALQSPFGEVLGHTLPTDYTPFLQRGALDGARIGRDIPFFD